ncbi:MAG: undecaprenyl-diphosphate phosphatase [Puniceicoccales bacterium]|jgi:undecaprenyl-diphosphatase|nr:undecaprenyl-diphosphate phosphatase [Puniceicoccales bacterium]
MGLRGLVFALFCFAVQWAPAAAADFLPTQWAPATAYGAVQGIAEYLPISSSAHLLLAEKMLLARSAVAVPNGGSRDFALFLQFISILAVPLVYGKRVAQIRLGMLGRSTEGLHVIAMLLLAFLPTAAVGALVVSFAGNWNMSAETVGWPLLAGGIYIILFERFCRRRSADRPLKSLRPMEAIAVGSMQTFAILPGLSRSLMSLTACLAFGLQPSAAVEFSFLLGFCTIAAATAHSVAGGAIVPTILAAPPSAICASAAAMICAVPSLLFFRNWIERKSLIPFAYYRIFAGAAVLLYAVRH